MRNVFHRVVVMAVGFGIGPMVAGAAAEPPAGHEASAKKFVELLAKQQFEEAAKPFDAAMLKAMPAEKLAETWKGIVKTVGPFQKQTGTRTERKDPYEIVFVTCEFAKTALDTRVVFDKEGKITGLFFAPAKKPAVEYRTPAYVRREAFDEKEIRVGDGAWALPGTLSLPKGEGPFPAVVLVHGSGPHDRDELIGPNRPFRDLAWGLASRGVAVLRYEKRTKEHGGRLVAEKVPVTIKEEVLDDAVAAVALLRRQPGVNGKKVFVVGHSLGGVLCPKIGTLDPDIAGLVSLAGSTRPLEDVIVEQVTYIAGLNADVDAKERIEKVKDQIAKLKDPGLTREAAEQEKLLGATLAYWLGFRGNYPPDVAARVKQPMLILQGERDYQVTMDDFQGWKKALEGHKDATFKSYPKLNHLFMEGKGKAKPEEYEKPGSVAQEVIEDIADWVKKH